MIQICARPTDEPVLNGEGVYSLEFKLGTDPYRPVMKVRARTGALAEEKLMICFLHELTGKTLSFDASAFRDKLQTAGTAADGIQAGSPDTNE